jgi:hypothetical protein
MDRDEVGNFCPRRDHVVDHRKTAADLRPLLPSGTTLAPPLRRAMSDIDWKLELRKIEREYDGLPPERSRTQIRLQKIQEIAAKQRFSERLSAIGIWARLILIWTLAVSLFWWPYGHRCGYSLATFLLSNVVVIVGGIVLAIRTWRERIPIVFGGAVLCVVMAWTIIALDVMPRMGYSPAGVTTARWSCVAVR